MKFFDLDWTEVLDVLPLWEKLSVAARRHYLLKAPSHAQSVAAGGYGADLELLLASGLVVTGAPGRIKPNPARINFRRIMAQWEKFPIFDTDNLDAMWRDYERKHFLQEELLVPCVQGRYESWHIRRWIEEFLNAPNVAKWEAPLKTVRYPRASYSWHSWGEPTTKPETTVYLESAEVGETARHLVRHALASPQPLPLRALGEAVPEPLRPHVPAAFKACLRYHLLYAALRPQTLEPVYWVHPAIGWRLHRPAPRAPAAVECSNLCGPAFWMEDMVLVLTEASFGGCRLKQGSYGWEFFQKSQQQLEAAAMPLPKCLAARFPVAGRLRQANQLLRALKLGAARAVPKGGLALVPTDRGTQWLCAPPGQRLHDLIREFLKPATSEFGEDADAVCKLVPGRTPFLTRKEDPVDLRPLLAQAFGQPTNPVPLAEFLDYQSRVSHPLTAPASSRAKHMLVGYSVEEATEENVEQPWRETLETFFWERLVPLGGVDTGTAAAGDLCFRLNGVGRCLLGLAPSFEYTQPEGENAIVVQPNFEVVFLYPNLPAEIELGPFTERCGKGTGTLFRLTRAAAMQAAAQGWTAARVLETLEKHAKKPAPGNVAAEVRSWFGACRHVPVRRSFLIDCPDRETALRFQQALGDACRPLADTLLEYRASTIAIEVRGRLMEQGLFLDRSSSGDES